jgi:ribosome-associated protein
MIRITGRIAIDERQIEESFIRACGPGGQNVNKLSTAVQLRFDVRRAATLPDDVRARLAHFAGRRMTQDGVLVITARRHRTRERNRADALARLIDLNRRAALPARARTPTQPSAAARQRRLSTKARRASMKTARRLPSPDD